MGMHMMEDMKRMCRGDFAVRWCVRQRKR